MRAGQSEVTLRILAVMAAVVQFLSQGAYACAQTLDFRPAGDANAGFLNCRVPVTALGAHGLCHGQAEIAGRSINIIASPDFGSEPHNILSGWVLRTEKTATGKELKLTGLALFLQGELLVQFDQQGLEDLVFRNDGAIGGKIISADGLHLVIALSDGSRRIIDSSTIIFIRSPRAFTFEMTGNNLRSDPEITSIQADLETCVFRPTAAPRVMSPTSILPARAPDPEGEVEEELLPFNNPSPLPGCDSGEPFIPFWHHGRPSREFQ